MKEILRSMNNALKHIEVLNDVFSKKGNFSISEELDFLLYQHNSEELRKSLSALDIYAQLYSVKERQMVLSDLYEYIFLGRGYYSLKTVNDKAIFIRAILHFVNLLMSYEVLTVSDYLRKKVLSRLGDQIGEIKREGLYSDIEKHTGPIGIGSGKSTASKQLEKYFDSLLPKTAGGLWHELLVYIFLLRNNCGYIIPNLLTQRWISLDSQIIPPDFLILTSDKRLYGIEVGTTKERQSGTFSLQTAIPTATIDTRNSRTSDRCPECKKWIQLCPHVINKYSDLEQPIGKPEVKCLQQCTIYSNKEDIARGVCPYTKYSRPHAKTLGHANHEYADGLHYHYKCILEKVSVDIKNKIINAMINGKDIKALKTHYPYYDGIEPLIKHKRQLIDNGIQLPNRVVSKIGEDASKDAGSN